MQAALIEIIGVNGEHWTVSGDGMGDQGVILDIDPEDLFDEAPWTAIWQQGATQQGATLMGVSEDPIDLTLGFKVFAADNGMPWDEVEARFYQSFHKTKPATIRVTTEAGARTLKVVKLERAKLRSKLDPRLVGGSSSIVSLRAPWPFWEGDTVTSTFTTTTTASSSGTVTVSNPTDVDIWLKWTVSAPGKWVLPDKDFEDTGAPRLIRMQPLATGQTLTIDSYPREETYVVADGSNYAGRMGGVDFLYPVPPRTPPTALPVSVSGHSSGAFAQVRMVQHWQRPIGGVY